MGLIKRLRRVSLARIESFLTSVEDPELVLPQLVGEMEEQVRLATETEAKAMATVKSGERKVEDAVRKVTRFGDGAGLAIEKGDEATAKDAVAAQIQAEAVAKREENALTQARGSMEDTRDARKKLQAELEELKAKKDEILTRARVAREQKNVQKTVRGPGGSGLSILDSVAQMEARVDEAEAELEVQGEMAGDSLPTLDQRLKSIEVDNEVERRLSALKKKGASSGQA